MLAEGGSETLKSMRVILGWLLYLRLNV